MRRAKTVSGLARLSGNVRDGSLGKGPRTDNDCSASNGPSALGTLTEADSLVHVGLARGWRLAGNGTN